MFTESTANGNLVYCVLPPISDPLKLMEAEKHAYKRSCLCIGKILGKVSNFVYPLERLLSILSSSNRSFGPFIVHHKEKVPFFPLGYA